MTALHTYSYIPFSFVMKWGECDRKRTVVPLHAMKDYRGRRGTPPFILISAVNGGEWWTSRPVALPAIKYWPNKKLGGSQGRSGRLVCVCFWRDSVQWTRASSFTRFLDHTQRRTSGRVITPSHRPLPDNTQHSQQTNIHASGGIRTHNLSMRAAADPRLRPRDHWGRREVWY